MNSTVGAFGMGAFCAVSLPLGAVLGIWMRPPARLVSAIMSFGAGALLSALTFELVSSALLRAGFWPMAIGTASGCVIFVLLNEALNHRGAFLRKSATLMNHLRLAKGRKIREVIEHLSRAELFLHLPADVAQSIAPHVRERAFPAGHVIFQEGDAGDALYIIESGQVEIGHSVAHLGPGAAFGEMAILTGEPRAAGAVAVQDVRTWEIQRRDFDGLLKTSPELRETMARLVEHRIRDGRLPPSPAKEHAEKWREEALKQASHVAVTPTAADIREAVQEQSQAGGNVAMAILLGAFLDGIPESVVVGASMTGVSFSMPLIAGIFISNLPESMSSAVLMKKQGERTSRILWMWMILVLVSGLSAMLGNYSFTNASPFVHSLIEGAAAGAMLAMVAQTMLPEAYEQGGSLVGLLTVLGFLSAIFIKTLEPGPHH